MPPFSSQPPERRNEMEIKLIDLSRPSWTEGDLLLSKEFALALAKEFSLGENFDDVKDIVAQEVHYSSYMFLPKHVREILEHIVSGIKKGENLPEEFYPSFSDVLKNQSFLEGDLNPPLKLSDELFKEIDVFMNIPPATGREKFIRHQQAVEKFGNDFVSLYIKQVVPPEAKEVIRDIGRPIRSFGRGNVANRYVEDEDGPIIKAGSQKPIYKTDEEGAQVKNEAGNPIIIGWTFDTEEDGNK